MEECAPAEVAPPATRDYSKIKLIVFDLNGVLLYSTHFRNEFPNVAPHGQIRSKHYWVRPYAEELIRTVLSSGYDVAVWTSNIRLNADGLTSVLFSKEERSKLKFVWAREQCDQGEHYSTTKNLQLIFNTWPTLYNPSNTLIVDDSDTKILMRECQYQISSWTPDQLTDCALKDLLEQL